MKKIYFKKSFVLFFLLTLIFLLTPILFNQKASAATFPEAYVRFDRMKALTFTSGLVCARTPATDTGTEVDVQVVFPNDFTVSATVGDWTVATTNIPSGATAWPGINTATSANNTTKTVIFPSSNLSTNTLYCFRWTNSTVALQTGSSGVNKQGTITTRATGPTNLDTARYATAIITDDQIVVTAVVPPVFYFTLSGNTDTFTSDLTTANVVSTTGRAIEIRTNATNGWLSWVRSANAGLNSASTGASIATAGTINGSPSDLNPTTGYVLDANDTAQGNGTGTMTIDGEYNGTTNEEGGTLSTTFQPVASANGTTDGDIFTLIERAYISSIQAAATDYTDTLTVIAAGRF